MSKAIQKTNGHNVGEVPTEMLYFGSHREITRTVDNLGFERFEFPIHDGEFALVDFYGKRFFSREMLKSLGFKEEGEHLHLTIAGVHNEWIDTEFSPYGGAPHMAYTLSFQGCATRLVLGANARRSIIISISKSLPRGQNITIADFGKPHDIALFAGEYDGKNAVVVEVTAPWTEERAAQKLIEANAATKEANSYLFGDDE
ncbi:MAG: hypothetical protein ACPG8W_08375 [Candidatus Promineifilaceae bacterium]